MHNQDQPQGQRPDPEQGIRVQRVLQQAGLASRRTAEEWVLKGRVTVNGTAAVVGQKVYPARDRILVDGRPLPTSNPKAYWMVYKPVGYTSSLKDRHAEHLITELLPKAAGRLYPVGRLDRDSSGLVIMTNDGALAYRLSHPKFQVPKVYEVWVEGVPRQHRLHRIERGIQLDDGLARPARVELLRAEGHHAQLRVVLTEGRKREIRRLLQAVGHPVLELTRVQYAGLTLGSMKPGEARALAPGEIRDLQQAVHRPGTAQASRSGVGGPPDGRSDQRRRPRSASGPGTGRSTSRRG